MSFGPRQFQHLHDLWSTRLPSDQSTRLDVLRGAAGRGEAVVREPPEALERHSARGAGGEVGDWVSWSDGRVAWDSLKLFFWRGGGAAAHGRFLLHWRDDLQ